MAVSVSKADALVEMVKAFDCNDVKKANKIGKLLSKSIQRDAKDEVYNEYIELNKESKQLFPVKIRKNKRSRIMATDNTLNIKIMADENIMEMILIEESVCKLVMKND